MALIRCIECGKEFSEHAEICPNCGCPKDTILKKLDNNKELIANSNDKNDVMNSEEVGKVIGTPTTDVNDNRGTIEESCKH